MANCRIGDLAVVVGAQLRCNLGRIVRVVAADDGKGCVVFAREGHVWTVECAQPLTWQVGGKRVRRRVGPVPDNRLRPIRGVPPGQPRRRARGTGAAPRARCPALSAA